MTIDPHRENVLSFFASLKIIDEGNGHVALVELNTKAPISYTLEAFEIRLNEEREREKRKRKERKKAGGKTNVKYLPPSTGEENNIEIIPEPEIPQWVVGLFGTDTEEERELSPDDALLWKSRAILDGIRLRLRITT